ncbi:MAG: terpene cyclase/mutase family protein [Ruminococcus sp.]|nr:terpene cyclase/mutase family protein [Ruminococcus sp.]
MKTCKTVICVLICSLIAVSASFTGFNAEAVSLDNVKSAVEGVISYKCGQANAQSVDGLLDSLGSTAGEFSADWYIIALSLYGVDCRNSRAVSCLKNKVREYYRDGISAVKVTDLQRTAFALMACGENIRNIEGRNLLADCTYNRAEKKSLDAQGVNSVAYALLLLDSDDFQIPEKASTTRDDMINMILDKELEGGGFALFGSSADVDVTAIVLQALAPYRSHEKASKAIDRAVSILSVRQSSDGAYKSFSNKPSAESTAQVALALCANGINPISDGRFVKEGNSVMDGLMSFKLDNGAFSHFRDGESDNIATYQSLCALVGCYRFMSGSKYFYDFKGKSYEKTSELNKVISKKKKTVSKASTTSKTKTKKNKQSAVKATEETQAATVLKSSAHHSTKITFSKNVKAKKKAKNPKKATVTATSDETSQASVSAKKSSVPDNTEKGESALYIPFALIFLGYPVLVVILRRRKK